MRDTFIIAGVGNNKASLEGGSNPSSSLAGLKITNSGIWLATESGNSMNLISMDNNGIKLGSVPSSGNSGSFVSIAQNKILIGSTAQLYINANNVELNTTYGGSGTAFRLGSTSDPELLFADGTLRVRGAITATSLMIGNQNSEDYVNSLISTGLNGYVTTTAMETALQSYATNSKLNDYAQYADFETTQANKATGIPAYISGKVWDTLGNGSYLHITTTGISLGSYNGNNNSTAVDISSNKLHITSTGSIQIDTGNLQVDSSGNVSITGSITASSGTIGGMLIRDDFGGWIGNIRSDPDAAANRWWSQYGIGAQITTWVAGVANYTFPVFWAGANARDHGPDNAPFRVFDDGSLYARSGNIAGWSIQANAFQGSGTTNDTVFLGKKTTNSVDWVMYAGATEPEGSYDSENAVWTGNRPAYWAPFRVNTKGELYTEVLCLGNGPANTVGDVKVGGNGWADYVGKLWLFVKYADDDYRWECIDSTALWKAVTNSSANTNYTPNQKPSGGSDSAGGNSSGVGGCFIAGTQVTLASGETIAIEKLQLGMKIIAYDEVKQQFDEAEITFVQMLKHKSHIYDIHLSTGKVITLTASHPLLTTNGWRSLDIDTTWQEYRITVNTLQINDKLISPYNDNIYIKDIKYREDLTDTTVYHCRVDPYHTFVVEDIVAHNMKVAVEP